MKFRIKGVHFGNRVSRHFTYLKQLPDKTAENEYILTIVLILTYALISRTDSLIERIITGAIIGTRMP